MTQFVGKAWDTWIQDLSSKAPSTRTVYLSAFEAFIKRWELEPEELYEMRRVNLESDDPRDKQNVERMVKIYMSELLEEGKAPNTVRQTSKAVGSFLESQGLELKLKAKDKPRVIANGQSLALRSHIRTMYDQVSPEMRERNRAIIMTLKDSGLRVSDVGLLDMEDWEKAKALKTEVGEFKVFEPKRTKKTGDLAYIHLGPEAVGAIEEYLKVRPEWTPRRKEKNGREPLFLDRSGKRIGDIALSRQVKYIGLKTGSQKVSAHSFRKFHKTRLEGAGMPEAWVKKLQGKTADVYSKPEETGELTTKYVKSYDALRVFKREASAQQVKDQAERIKELEAEVEILRAGQNREIKDMKSRLDEQEKILKFLYEKLKG